VVDLEAAKKRRAIEDEKLANEFRVAEDLKNSTAGAKDAAAGDVDRTKSLLAAPALAREQRRALEIELQNLQRRPGGTSPEAMARGDRMREIAGILKSPDVAGGVSSEYMAALQQRLGRQETDYEKVSKA